MPGRAPSTRDSGGRRRAASTRTSAADIVDVAAAVADLDAGARAEGDRERAPKEKAYLKSDLEFYGATVPALRRLAKEFQAAHPTAARAEVVAVVEGLWAEPVFERRLLAVLVAENHVEVMAPTDIAMVEEMLRHSRTWALIDNLAATVAGPLLDRHPDADAILDRWAGDEDFWIRRSALLAHLLALRQGEGDFERFGRYADTMLEDKEFFIRKAIGWVLRDTARRRPQLVYEWLAPRAHRASGVTVREAVKRLPPDQSEEILAAYRSR